MGLAGVHSFQAKSTLINVSDGVFICKTDRTHLTFYQLRPKANMHSVFTCLVKSLSKPYAVGLTPNQNGELVTNMIAAFDVCMEYADRPLLFPHRLLNFCIDYTICSLFTCFSMNLSALGEHSTGCYQKQFEDTAATI